MKGIVRVVNFLPKGAGGFTIFPFVLVSDERLKEHKEMMNHERIHLSQQLETLVIFGFLMYYIEYRIGLKKYNGNKFKAYENISFEREAYANQGNPNYLKERKLFSFLKYLK